MSLHMLKLLRNFFPMLVGYFIGAYFAAKYYLLVEGPIYAEAYRLVPLHETPEVFADFYTSIIFIVSGILINVVWIFVLAKFNVE
ncbi:MAG: hypothetical protein ACE5KG_07270 [Nitrososphaerales archaeon]